MEKAILKTLAYADIFDYPLKAYEIHKWLIGRKATLRQVENALEKLYQVSNVKYQAGYYVLPRRDGLVNKRARRRKQSAGYFKKAHFLVQILKLVPWIKLVGISGGLAMDNAKKGDDIDLFMVISKNRLWISRLLALGLLSLTGQRRKVGEKGRKIAGKVCLNILLEEDSLEQSSNDIYLAHEVLQMRPLWQRDGIYQKYLENNEWAFRFLPNWTARGPEKPSLSPGRHLDARSHFVQNPLVNLAENLAKLLQLKIMGKPQGMERIQDGAVYFHPNDIRPKVLAEYIRKTKNVM